MRRCLFFTAAFILASSLGCQSTQDTTTQAKKVISYQASYIVPIDFSQLPEKIPPILEELNIALVDTKKTTGSCVYIGTSLSGHTVKVEIAALVKGESVIYPTVEGDKNVGGHLYNKVSSALRSALLNAKSQ
jgi:hypothetical protein